MDGQFMPLKTPTCELQSKDDDDTRLLLLNGLLESILYPVTKLFPSDYSKNPLKYMCVGGR